MEQRAGITYNTHGGTQEPSPCLHSLAAHGLYVHSIPGRLRMELPGLLGNPLLAQRLNLALLRLPGAQRVSASAATGRLLVEYDDRLDRDQVLSRLHELGSLSVCGHGCTGHRFTSPNTLVELALEQAVKLGVKLLLGL